MTGDCQPRAPGREVFGCRHAREPSGGDRTLRFPISTLPAGDAVLLRLEDVAPAAQGHAAQPGA